VLQSAGTAFLAAMMFLTASDVALRYLFNSPINGSHDLTELMMGVLVAFGLAYCAMTNGHVSVELLVERMPIRARVIINVCISLIGFVLFALITWQCFVNVAKLIDNKLSTYVLHIPLYPVAGNNRHRMSIVHVNFFD
jgi:TRAP-type C4-dicarboxylate transport system permease small subunit